MLFRSLVDAMPQRCLAGIWVKNNHLPPKNRQVPALVTYGTAQEWGQDKSDIRTNWNNIGKAYDGILEQRRKYPDWPFSYIIDGHSGHFDCSEPLVQYFARYIDLVAKARCSDDGSPTLKSVKMKSGFYADLPVPGHEGQSIRPAATHAALPWYFDRASAEAAQAFAAINWKAETQFPAFVDDKGNVLPCAFNGIADLNLKTMTMESDGITFTVRGTLLERIPEGFACAGEKLGKASGTPELEWLCGPVASLGHGRLRIVLDRTCLNGGTTYVALRQAGTDTLRGVVQPMRIDLRQMNNREGQPQKIIFEKINDVKAGTVNIPLVAQSDAGLPVEFFVIAGPAVVKDGKLLFTSIPPRTRFPVEVTVGAWQWGRAVDPKVKTADIVKQTFMIHNNVCIDPDGLDDDRWQPDQRVTYKRVDGLDLPMALFLPKDRLSIKELRPAVVCIHGGAWSGWRGGDWQTWDGGILVPHARYFSARGAVGVTISYRHVLRPAKDKAAFEKGPSLFELYADCRSAVRYLRQNAERLGIDPKRIAVIGDSAGGHLAACLGTIDRFDEPGEDKSVSAMANLTIPCNPITDLLDPKWLDYVPETPRAWEGDKPLSREARAKAISPLWNVTSSSAPSLLLHGLADGVVAPAHSSDLQKRMQKAGIRSELSTLPGASHAFILLGYRSTGSEFLAVMRTVDRFLAAAGYLAGEAVLAGPTPRGCLTIISGDRLADGRISGTNGMALVLPDAKKPGVTKAEVVEDAPRGRVLKINKGAEGLALTGQHSLGIASTVSLWIKPDKFSGTLVRRSVGTNPATGYKLSLGSKGALTWQVAGTTLIAVAPPLNAWSQIMASVSSNNATLYLNGKLVAEQALDNATLIGTHLSVGENYSGLLSDLRIFDTPMTHL